MRFSRLEVSPFVFRVIVVSVLGLSVAAFGQGSEDVSELMGLTESSEPAANSQKKTPTQGEGKSPQQKSNASIPAAEAPAAEAPAAEATTTQAPAPPTEAVTVEVPPPPEAPAETVIAPGETKEGESVAPTRAPRRHVGIEEIVVTAQKREQNINDIPLSISAYSGEDMKELGVTDTRDLGKVVPGFVAADSGYSTPVYNLRGVGFSDISYSSTGTVGVYTDETSLPYAIMTRGANVDVQRVEVLKGPQGTLYGRNSTGGTINYIANKPTEDLESGITLGLSRFLTTDAEAFVSGKIVNTLRGRLAIHDLHSQQGWQISNTRPADRLGQKDKQSGRGTLDWEPLDNLLLRLTFNSWLDHSDPQAPFAVAFRPQNKFTGTVTADPRVQNYPYIPNNNDPRIADWAPDKHWHLNDDFWTPALRTEWRISDTLGFTGLLSYAQFHSGGSTIPQSGNDTLQSEQSITGTLKTYSGEGRLAGTLGKSINWLGGVSSGYDETAENHLVFIPTNSFNFPPPGTGNPTGEPFLDGTVGQVGSTRANSNGVFASSDWQFADAWKVTQGLRYTWESRSYEGCTYVPPESQGVIGFSNLFNAVAAAQADPNALAQATAEGRFPIQRGDCFTLDKNGVPGMFRGHLGESNVSTHTVLDWTPVEDALLYASYTRGYKSGGFPVILAARQANFTPVTQERLIAYELGAKAGFLDRRVHLDVAGFYYDYTDKQMLTFILDDIFGSLPLIKNVPKSKVAGAELSLNYSPLEGLNLSTVGSYIYTRVGEFVSTTAQGTQFEFKGRPFNFAPVWQAVALGNYVFPITQGLELGPGMDIAYASATNATLEGDPAYVMPSYWNLNARFLLASADRKWSVTAFGSNLTNELRRTGVFRTGDSVAAFAAFPRMYGVTGSYMFR